MLLTRRHSILSGIEGTYSVDPTLTGALNAMLITATPTITPMDLKYAPRNLLRAFFGNSEQLPSELFARLQFPFELAGSNNAGVATPWGHLLRGAGFAETLFAAAVVGNAQAGGAATLRLAAGASAVDNFYRGCKINTTGGTGAGQSNTIVAYNGTTKDATMADAWGVATDATTTYSIPKQVTYQPIFMSLESVTQYGQVETVKHILTGARGDLSLDFSEDAVPTGKWDAYGIWNQPTDAAVPTVVYTPWTDPLPVNRVNTLLTSLGGYAAATSSFSLTFGNKVVKRSLPGSTDKVIITDRMPTSKILMEAVSVATKDWWSIVKAGTKAALQYEHGIAAGNTIRVCLPKAQIMNPAYSDQNGVVMMSADLIALPLNGGDDILISVL